MARDWTQADRISDSIVDIFNAEFAGDDPLQLLAGWLLAFKALQRTMPNKTPRPLTLKALEKTVDMCLHAIFEL